MSQQRARTRRSQEPMQAHRHAHAPPSPWFSFLKMHSTRSQGPGRRGEARRLLLMTMMMLARRFEVQRGPAGPRAAF